MEFWKKLKIDNKIKHVSILVYTRSKISDEILILVGKEFNNKPNKTDVNLYSNFYGGFDNDESIAEAASRILFESTMNMIIDQEKLCEEILNKTNIKYKIIKDHIMILYQIDYDKFKDLPTYYNRVFAYINLCRTSNSMNNWIMETCPFDYFNKSELIWINYNFIVKNIKQFKRKFIYNLFS